MSIHKCWSCGIVCNDGRAMVEAQWSCLNEMRDTAVLGIERAQVALEERILRWREEVSTLVSREPPRVRNMPPGSRHLAHFVTMRKKNLTRADVCLNCIEEVCKMWTHLQMQMHVAIGEILEWADWNSLETDELYDNGMRDVYVSEGKRRALLKNNVFG